ncbi:DUF3301 domain-containing protein [Steroidobacter sp.]|uniref:DUF3301 domain-containing protein n=1 Tax=Steroidobacter sp. TaxID=1978227 RepID=UPI001A4A08D6|nr:DUF3301 domain-containing protein [Steroidobacter sp.]MBL8269353.1 DUF3301 domain-containing protein [Steroidobacter sp.]
MELGWGALVLLVAGAAVVWFLQDSLAARERANVAAMEACQRLSLQFLDGTVAFARLAFAREQGQLAIRRTYVFDYTANSIERRQGFVILLGRRVESVGYAPGEERRGQPQPPPITISASATFTPPPAEQPPAPPPRRLESAQVLDLADWRARRRDAEKQQSPTTRRPAAPDPGHADGQDHHQ